MMSPTLSSRPETIHPKAGRNPNLKLQPSLADSKSLTLRVDRTSASEGGSIALSEVVFMFCPAPNACHEQRADGKGRAKQETFILNLI